MKNTIIEFLFSAFVLVSFLFAIWALGNIWFGEPISRLLGQPYSDVRGLYYTPDHKSILITGTKGNVTIFSNEKKFDAKVSGNQIRFKNGYLYYYLKTELTAPNVYQNMTGFYILKGIINGDTITGLRTEQFHEEESFPSPSISTDF